MGQIQVNNFRDRQQPTFN